MRIAVCDDDLQIVLDIANALKSIDTDCITEEFSSCDALWHEYQERNSPFDLIVLDIQMPSGMDGLTLAKRIREQEDAVPIVIISDYAEYLPHGYEVRPHQFLQKPVNVDDLAQIACKIQEEMNVRWETCLNIKQGGGFQRIPFEKIAYLESRMHTIFVHCRNGRVYQFNQTLRAMRSCLDERFVQIHKSYIVNLNCIENAEKRHSIVNLFTQSKLPVGRKYRENFKEAMEEYGRCYFLHSQFGHPSH